VSKVARGTEVIRVGASLIAVALHVLLPAVLAVVHAYAKVELPEVAVPPMFREVYIEPLESFSPLSLLQGATESEVARVCRVRAVGIVRPQTDVCVRYQYSARLSYILLFRNGVVDSMWLTEDAFVPYRCERIVVKTIHIPPQPWLPSQALRQRSGLGCAPADETVCSAP
jgi:hypothetical protein